MTSGFAELTVGVEYGDGGEVTGRTFDWRGPKSAPILVAKQLIDDLVEIAPWRLVVDVSRRSPVAGCFIMWRVP